MKKILSTVLTLVEIFGVLAFFIINHFTETRMGMMRHVMYRNSVYSEGIFSSANIKIISIALLLVFCVNTYFFIKERSLRTILPLLAFLYVVFMNADKQMSYYYGVIISVIILVCELIFLIDRLFIKNRTSKFDK